MSLIRIVKIASPAIPLPAASGQESLVTGAQKAAGIEAPGGTLGQSTLDPCDPAAVETLEGYWLGRAKVRADEALKRMSHAAVPSDGDVMQHRMAQEYERRAKALATEGAR